MMDDRGPRRWIAATTLAAVAGVAISVYGHEALGSWLTVGGLAGALAALHRFGRTGADEA